MKTIDQFKSCYCNRSGANEIVKLLEYPHGRREMIHTHQPEIIFMVSGSAQITMGGTRCNGLLTRGEFIFAPQGSHLVCSFSDESAILEVRLSGDPPAECPVFKLDRTAEKATGYKTEIELFALKANRRIRNLVAELMATLNDGFICRHFLNGETNRLLFLLNAYYPEEDRVKFFSHVLTPDIRFSEYVRMNYMKFRTIGELADSLRMPAQAFSQRFRRVFGTTPHKWMQQEKARNMYLDICRSDMPLKEISLKYGFPLSSNFFRFCKATFGDSPGNIRKSLHKNLEL